MRDPQLRALAAKRPDLWRASPEVSSRSSLHLLGSRPASEAAEDEVLVPDDRYEVAFLREKKHCWFGGDVWRVEFKIIAQGPHFGMLLPCWFRLPKPSRPLRRGHGMAQAWVVATGTRFPKDLARHRPSWFLKGCTFEVATRTVTR